MGISGFQKRVLPLCAAARVAGASFVVARCMRSLMMKAVALRIMPMFKTVAAVVDGVYDNAHAGIYSTYIFCEVI